MISDFLIDVLKKDSGTVYFNDEPLELKDVVIGVDRADGEDMTSICEYRGSSRSIF